MIKYYFVGGYVRDKFLGVNSKDIDFAVEGATYEEMRQDIINKGGIIWQEKPEYLSIRGRLPDVGAADFTICRKDGYYSDGRRPDDVQYGTIYDDLARRDFTINAIAEYAENGNIIDPHNGIRDIQTKYLRCVGDSKERFAEDSLRILRAIRFHITKGFYIGEDIQECLRNEQVLKGLKNTSVERIYEELNKCFEWNSYYTQTFLRSHRLLEDILFGTIGMKLRPLVPYA